MIRRVNPFERNGCLLDEGPGGRDPEGDGMLDRLLGMISLDNPDGGSGYLSFLKWRRVRSSFFGFEDGLYWGLSGGRGRRNLRIIHKYTTFVVYIIIIYIHDKLCFCVFV